MGKKKFFSGQVPALDREGRRKARVYFEVKKPTSNPVTDEDPALSA